MKFIDLFRGLSQNAIPTDAGYIVSSNFSSDFNYAILEVIAFGSVKNIYPEEDGVIFQSDGKKLYILFEPREYPKKHIEPTFREMGKAVPHRFNEMNIVATNLNDRLMIGKVPIFANNSFSVSKPDQGNFAYYFYQNDEILENILEFLESIFKQDFRLAQSIRKKAMDLVEETLEEFEDLQYDY